jgi:hypothetical protein
MIFYTGPKHACWALPTSLLISILGCASTAIEKVCTNGTIFLGAASDGAAPIVSVLGTYETSSLYKWHSRGSWWYEPPLQLGRFVGTTHSPATPTVAICRGGSITSRPYKCSTYKRLQSPSFSSGHSLFPKKKSLGGLGHLPKITLLRGEGFGLKSFGREVVEGKKMLFQTFLKF